MIRTTGDVEDRRAATLAAFRGRVLNTHPALLPKSGGPGMFGDHVFRATLAAGESHYTEIPPMSTSVPSGTELARPFLPAKDFDVSKAFYEALGFEKVLDGEVAIYRVGAGGFILQRYYQKDWAENSMMQLMVDDLDVWWAFITSLDLPSRFGVAGPTPPKVQPWGLRIAYLVDPAGVLWHVSQRRAGHPQD